MEHPAKQIKVNYLVPVKVQEADTLPVIVSVKVNVPPDKDPAAVMV